MSLQNTASSDSKSMDSESMDALGEPACIENVVEQLVEIGAICFGNFILKSGIKSPIYIDMRMTMCRPKLMMHIAKLVWQSAVTAGIQTELICGVPTGAIPLATCMSFYTNKGMVFARKELKDYGRSRRVEGKFKPGSTCVVLEDVFVSGQSTMETVEVLRNEGLIVKDAVVFLDREQGGKEILKKESLRVISTLTMTELLDILYKTGKIKQDVYNDCVEFIQSTKLKTLPRHLETASKPNKLDYQTRASLCKHPLTKQLFSIMADKQTNIALSADVTSCSKLLKIAEELGPYICILKTHVDILKDFTLVKMKELGKLAKKHSFLIFEDSYSDCSSGIKLNLSLVYFRKFADIGNTVRLQYEGGTYEIANWSHITNAHPLPGPGVVNGLKSVGLPKNRACVLVAQMSSVDHLCSKDYVEKTVVMSNRNKDFIIGFICQSYLTSDPEMVHMIPGVKLERGTDGLGQGYITPEEAFDLGADLIIVGRGILNAKDQTEMAKKYRDAGYNAYQSMITKT